MYLTDEHVWDAEVFLAYMCRLTNIQRLITDEREYQLLIAGYKNECQFQRLQTRDICFYQFLNYRGKTSHINRPSDLWSVTDEEIDKKLGYIEGYEESDEDRLAKEKGFAEFFETNNE